MKKKVMILCIASLATMWICAAAAHAATAIAVTVTPTPRAIVTTTTPTPPRTIVTTNPGTTTPAPVPPNLNYVNLSYGEKSAKVHYGGENLTDATLKIKIGRNVWTKQYAKLSGGKTYSVTIGSTYKSFQSYTCVISGKSKATGKKVSITLPGNVSRPPASFKYWYLLKGDKKQKVGVRNVKKGDVLVVSVGGKKYRKKFKSSFSGEKIVTLKIKKAKAGQKVRIWVEDKFGVKVSLGTTDEIVYKTKKFKRGMKMKAVKMVAGFRKPAKTVDSGQGTYWYYDRDRDGRYEGWIQFINGKVNNWYFVS